MGQKKGHIPWNKGLHNNKTRLNSLKVIASREKNGTWIKNVKKSHQNPERNRKISEHCKGRNMLTSEQRRLNVFKSHGKHIKHASKIEYQVMLYLTELGIKYKFQVPINNKYLVDFVVGDIIIEVNGYWHKLLKEKDRERKDYLELLGYRVYQIETIEKNYISKSQIEKILLENKYF